MANKQQVIDLHKRHPDWNSVELAAEIGCSCAYVRSTFKRNGLRLVGRPRKTELMDLGRACRDAGITLADILEIADQTVRRAS